jgi:hypothetical protein
MSSFQNPCWLIQSIGDYHNPLWEIRIYITNPYKRTTNIGFLILFILWHVIYIYIWDDMLYMKGDTYYIYLMICYVRYILSDKIYIAYITHYIHYTFDITYCVSHSVWYIKNHMCIYIYTICVYIYMHREATPCIKNWWNATPWLAYNARCRGKSMNS